METETAKTESSRVAEEVPTVIAKKREPLSKEEQNAAELSLIHI